MGTRRISPSGTASACYFRTTTTGSERKALLQITERCNLHCAHCFVSAGREGIDIPLAEIETAVLPQLVEARVRRLTLTGGEPFAHPDVLGILRASRALELPVTVCTNGTLVEDDALDEIQALGGVRFNVSLDGFRAESHGKFRGAPSSFMTTVETARRLGERGLLKGILATPNMLAEPGEYAELCEFARAVGAEYVLMNPLASMGRGVRGRQRLGTGADFMRLVQAGTQPFDGPDLNVVHIRFPNDPGAPLSACEAGTIVYVFATGDVTVCPYLVFAARTPQSRYPAADFIVGNVFEDQDIAARLDAYKLHDRATAQADPLCGSCSLASRCGRGCPAAVIASGGELGDRDTEQCPRTGITA